MKPFKLMVTFMTRIPLKTDFEIKEEDFIKGIWYMPVIGLAIGLLLYLINLFLLTYISPYAGALITVILYIAITGGLHLDGLADTADAIFSNRDKDRMLEIMKDSRIGAFGVLAILIYFLSMIIFLAEVPVAVLLFPLAGRSCALLACASSTYARTSGLGKTIVENTKAKHVVFTILLTLAAVCVLFIITGIVFTVVISVISLAAVLICTYFIARSISNKLGGITGDVVGFIIEATSILFVAAYYISSIFAVYFI